MEIDSFDLSAELDINYLINYKGARPNFDLSPIFLLYNVLNNCSGGVMT